MSTAVFKYAYIMDYSYPGIYEIEITDDNRDLYADELLDKYGLNENCCYVMFSQTKLQIETLTKE